jgi:TPR repeat protein
MAQYLDAAERGDSEAMYELACAYSNGEDVAKDYVKARMWFSLQWESGYIVGGKVFFSPSSDEQREELARKIHQA